MRLIHLSDLHIGKRVNGFSMLEDQEFILKRILKVIDEEKPDGVIIAGDVYDKTIPSEEAVQLLDDFLTRLAERKLQVYVISGNHDSAAKLSFASKLIDLSGIHLSPLYDGKVEPFVLGDGEEKVCIYMLPFIKPAMIRGKFPEEEISNYTDAMRVAIEHMEIDKNACNILVAHQFVTGASRSESEDISVGGLDNVEASVFEPFDYVALGHIHGPQHIGKETIRYCGTPLKYSFSEATHKKSVTVIEIDKKHIEIRTIELKPKHDMRRIKGTYEELTDKRNYDGTSTDDYLEITLTDEDDIMDAMGKLRIIYPNLMVLRYDNQRTRKNQSIGRVEHAEEKSPMELFAELYEMQNNMPMSEEQRNLVEEMIEKIWEDK